MEVKRSNFFSVMVVGENPTTIMGKYNKNTSVGYWVKYKYSDKEKMYGNRIKLLMDMIENPTKFNISNPSSIEYFKQSLEETKRLTPFEYYQKLVVGYKIDENGDALSDENPNGKWTHCGIGKNFSLPLKLKNGSVSYSSVAKNVDWDSMHMENIEQFENTWELIVDKKPPTTQIDDIILTNMKDKLNYFSAFKDKEEYVIHNCAYWNYAYVDENNWVSLDDDKEGAYDWISTFFDKFVVPLKESDKLVSIFECQR